VAGLRLDGVSKRYAGSAVDALQPVDLTIDDGEFITMLGPSGCGKTTLLKGRRNTTLFHTEYTVLCMTGD